ncbi:DUF2891 domain-containing protein [Siphonobacter sp.]|uniref:DUF2891 domain-containing protein n=1 Tax=Siphonobacter sp. TaxID=1869184 RepID=UPI003B3A6A27
MKYGIFLAGLAMSGQVLAQTPSLTEAQASHLASLPLHCITQVLPNKPNHTYEFESDLQLTPQQLHPSFYGCLDWHSSVHGHWMLVRLLKTFPTLPEQSAIRAVLDSSFQASRLQAEAAYFDTYKLAKGFERTYGWAWLLKLDEELQTWNDPQAKVWHQNLQPLTAKILTLWKNFLPKQTYPNRTGVHPNTAFGLVFALDYARTVKDTAFEKLIIQRSKDYYGGNTNAPGYQEPDGTDFLSPSLEVCDLMRRVLPAKDFIGWFDRYLSKESLNTVTKLPFVSDRTDYSIVHLDGLCLSRAWCMKGIASALPKQDKRRQLLLDSASEHLSKTLPHVAAGNYGGEHWLASFAVYALSVE